jgi:hypothetical protein
MIASQVFVGRSAGTSSGVESMNPLLSTTRANAICARNSCSRTRRVHPPPPRDSRCTLVQLIAGVPYQDGNRSRTIPAEPHRTGYSFTVETTLRTKAAIEQARLAPPSVRRGPTEDARDCRIRHRTGHLQISAESCRTPCSPLEARSPQPPVTGSSDRCLRLCRARRSAANLDPSTNVGAVFAGWKPDLELEDR